MSEPMPNPASVSARFDVSSSVAGQLRLFDPRGVEVLSKMVMPEDHQSVAIDAHLLPAGLYKAVLQTGSLTTERTLVVLH
jgi:hypothetical protein